MKPLHRRIRPPRHALGEPVIETPLEGLYVYWRQVSPEDHLRFLAEVLTPTERRALQFEFEGEEEEP